jgi:hypothetical protein
MVILSTLMSMLRFAGGKTKRWVSMGGSMMVECGGDFRNVKGDGVGHDVGWLDSSTDDLCVAACYV